MHLHKPRWHEHRRAVPKGECRIAQHDGYPMNAINYGTPAKLGMLLPSGNQAAEPQFHAMLPAGVSLHTMRLKLTGSSEKDLLAMELNAELVRIVRLPETRERLTAVGIEPVSSTPEELGRFIRSETARYGKIIRDPGLKIE